MASRSLGNCSLAAGRPSLTPKGREFEPRDDILTMAIKLNAECLKLLLVSSKLEKASLSLVCKLVFMPYKTESTFLRRRKSLVFYFQGDQILSKKANVR